MPLTTYARTLVSGNKARYIDEESDINLDLVYGRNFADSMGYPATGIKALYRNKRDDVLRFLNARHGDKWWIWNLCPLTENAYSSESMGGRVSRYPFPDHNPPPLPLLPLAVREMTAWLEGDPERIAIIHCKAGKGRSGTLLVSYLLSLPELPSAPTGGPLLDESKLGGNVKDTLKETVIHKTNDIGVQDTDSGVAEAEDSRDEEDALSEPAGGYTSEEDVAVPKAPTASGGQMYRRDTHVEPVAAPVPDQPKNLYVPIAIGDEEPLDSPGQWDRRDGKLDEILTFHSSRRMKPSTAKARRGVSIASQRRWCRYVHLLFQKRAPLSYLTNAGHVRLVSMTMVLKRPHGWQKPLSSLVVGGNGGQGKAGASVARYKDEYVAQLRALGGGGEGVEGDITWGGVAGDGVYDSAKMFKVFARLVPSDIDAATQAALLPGEADEYNVHHLVPPKDVIMERAREFRIKLHLGSLPMGWAWFIPAFHLAEPASPGSITAFDVPRSQLDFPLGPGAAVKRVIMRLEEVNTVGR
ncbi:uncharacterized protein COLE_02797 [Cutaneotrichosporon oleaginosum]|uniref:uncharacterized protein n=1 Tax=Cutaneotrichosporon oleaginosum TaxID=879819 RepID=UPI00132263E1|nr:hypothetical protein COLE_02797 [Cutaneotrichosporon oleaginosum]